VSVGLAPRRGAVWLDLALTTVPMLIGPGSSIIVFFVGPLMSIVGWGTVMGQILIEVSPASRPEGGQDLAPRIPEKFHDRAPEIAAAVAEVAKDLSPQVAGILGADASSPWAIDEFQMTFGVAAQVGSNIVVVSASGQATFTVTVTWSRKG
jgi:Trypsin-co-occurring domain 1